jgi:ATP phosphoribosyltransferase
MLVDETRLHIAIQKSGRLSDYSRALLRDAGLRIQNGRNELTARVENFPADLMFVRDDDIPTFVSDGICDFGVVGENVLQGIRAGEPSAFEVLARWLRPLHLKIAAPEATAYDGPASLEGRASPPPIAHRPAFLDENTRGGGVKMNGAVELAPRRQIALHLRSRLTGATLERTAVPSRRCSTARRADPHAQADSGGKAARRAASEPHRGRARHQGIEIYHAERAQRGAEGDHSHPARRGGADHPPAPRAAGPLRRPRGVPGICLLGDASRS